MAEKLFERTGAGWEKKPKGRQVLKTKVASDSQIRTELCGSAQGGSHAEFPLGSFGDVYGAAHRGNCQGTG
jgi:hypothetical protein